MQSSLFLLTAMAFIALILAPTSYAAFAPASSRMQQQQQQQQRTVNTALHGGLFGNNGVLGNLMGGGNNDAGGVKTIIDIPAKDVKIGALRFLLNICLVSEQNKPEPKSWLAKQGDGAGDLLVYYQDGTGMLSIELAEYGIKMTRHGQKPSLQYQLQESILLHSILDELANVAFGVEDIEADKRLLVLQDDSVLDKAREKLPARQA